ncbi:MAG TPA: hypothetical protein VHW24_04065 [Bryobacteraceae bacterium]|nr:hypothetical protein [Bryobacteraceae bacterium]
MERSFHTAPDRLVKGLRVAGAKTLEQANAYLEAKFIPWWNQTLAVVPASSDDAHRPLGKEHSLATSLSYVETRQVSNDYTNFNSTTSSGRSHAATFARACAAAQYGSKFGSTTHWQCVSASGILLLPNASRAPK